jgi:hypothetical protein
MSAGLDRALRWVAYGPEWRDAWDGCVRAARNGHFMFERGYVEYHGTRFRDRSLLFVRGPRVAAILPAHQEGQALVSHQGLPFAGLVVADPIRLAETRAALRLTLHAMAEWGLRELVVSPVPPQYTRTFCDEQVWTLLELGAVQSLCKPSAVMRIGSPPGPRRRLAKALRQAGRSTLRVGESDDVPRFMGVLRDFLERIGGRPPVHSTEELVLLKCRFPDSIRLLTVADEGSQEWLAAQLCYISERCVRLQYLAETAEGRRRQATLALMHHLLTDPHYQGRFLDFGTSMDPVTGLLDDELVRHKEGFGARLVLQSTYRLRLNG